MEHDLQNLWPCERSEKRGGLCSIFVRISRNGVTQREQALVADNSKRIWITPYSVQSGDAPASYQLRAGEDLYGIAKSKVPI